MKIYIIILLFCLSNVLVAQNTWQHAYGVFDVVPNGQENNQDEGISLIIDESVAYFLTTSICNGTTFCVGFFKIDYDNGDVIEKKIFIDSINIPFLYPAFLEGFIRANDGGFIITGTVKREYEDVMFMMKLDGNGNKLWLKSYESEGVAMDRAHNVVELLDGNFVLSGGGVDENGKNKITILKVDANGEVLWSNTYGFEQYLRSPLYGNLIVLPSGEMIALFSGGDLSLTIRYTWLAKFDEEGNVLWVKRAYLEDVIYKHKVIKNLPDGNVLIMTSRDTSAMSLELQDFATMVTKLDTEGNVLWEYAFISNHINVGNNINLTITGEILINGELDLTQDIFPVSGAWIAKLSADGELIWYRAYTIDSLPTGGFLLALNDLKECPDGSLMGVGSIDGILPNGQYNRDAWVLKLDSEGCFYPDDCGEYNFIITDNVEVLLPSRAFNISPNPSSTGICTIASSTNITDAEIYIFNVLGQLVAKKSLQKGRNTFTLPRAGIYFVSIVQYGKIIGTEKVIFTKK